jgi:ATP/maltotriose-dependent transcriptional regulator MalT
VQISKSYLFSTHGELDEAVASAERAAAMSTGKRYHSEEARLALGQALSLRGDVLGTRAALEPALPFYEAHPLERFSQTGTRSIWCHGHLAHANCLSGNLEQAKIHADRAVTLAEETGRPLDRVFAMHRRGEVLLEREAYPEAAEMMEEAMDIAEHVDAPLFTVWFGCDIVPAYIALGRMEPARQLLARQEPEARRLSLHQFAACLALRRGEIALVDGREDEATKQAEAALLTARSAGYLVLETAALRLAGSVERLRDGSTSTLEAAAALAEARGLAGEARRARASGALPYGAPGTI